VHDSEIYLVFLSTVVLLFVSENMFICCYSMLHVVCCRGSDGKFELDFESNPADIINSEHHEMDAVYRPVVNYTPEYRRSLRVSKRRNDHLYGSFITSAFT